MVVKTRKSVSISMIVITQNNILECLMDSILSDWRLITDKFVSMFSLYRTSVVCSSFISVTFCWISTFLRCNSFSSPIHLCDLVFNFVICFVCWFINSSDSSIHVDWQEYARFIASSSISISRRAVLSAFPEQFPIAQYRQQLKLAFSTALTFLLPDLFG